jgi:hypothetical protein
MVFQMNFRKNILMITLLSLPLVVGSRCAFFFSSGDGSADRDKQDKKDDQVVVVKSSGSFGEPPAQGVSYASGALSGVTGENGEFQYEVGKTVRFFVGEVNLGAAVAGKSVITPQDLVPDSAPDSPAVINISRLLLSLDSNPDDDVITIPKTVRTTAVRSNEDVAAAIEFLDFSDETAFVNAASQLVNALTRDYPYTAMLVDADNAQERVMKTQ